MGKLFTAATVCAVLLPLPGIVACNGKNEPEAEAIITPARCLPRIIRTLPHDTAAFTQGLVFNGETLYESTGLQHQSSLRALDANGVIHTNRPMSGAVFAEGCAVCAGNLYQLTWRERQCFVYALPGLTCIDTLSYTGEGWGLTSNGIHLIMSNGSDTLYVRDRRFSIMGKIPVTREGKPLSKLNELEFARGRIYANVWFSDYIFEINPRSGIVERIIDCGELVVREAPTSDDCVLNGIAYHSENGLFYLTGKKWKNMFVVEIPVP
ncbi:MAG: glutaminyl-peptide cyclotransferase [Chitinispirillaceae bacterium]|nr:glutaminyl-peptide cyclotransferase [Chitinispirillaceae bacterium]